MAEFALGLTKTAVEGTVSLVKSAVEEEKKLRDKVQNDLVFITDEFEMMQSFLRVANRDRAKNQVVLTWMRQLRNLAFDVEDCVEFVVHLDNKSSALTCWVRGKVYLRRAWQKLYCWASPLPLDVAIAEIKKLKARVEDVSLRNTRYNLLLLHDSNDNKQPPEVVTAAAVMRPAVEPVDATTYYPTSAPAFHILRDVWEATGRWRRRDMGKGNLIQQELLIARGDGDDEVVSVWGGGDDLGTAASIITEAYWDPEICKNFKRRAWVKLTHPYNFNPDEFVKSLLAQFSASSSSRSHQANDAGVTMKKRAEVTEQETLPNKLMKEMREQRYLLVLENVLAVAQWNVIRMYLPDSNNGSRIVVSTPQLGIALLCAGDPYQASELRKFPDADKQFLCAFKKTRRDTGEFYRQLRRQGVISVWGADNDDRSNLVDILHKGLINGWFKDFMGVSNADKADHVGMLRKGIRNRIRKFDAKVGFERDSWVDVEFKQHSWVDVPVPFELKVFAQRLFLNFHSDDIRATKIKKGGMMGEAGLIEWCRKFLFEKEDCLVVINGLKSMHDWDLIKSNFLLSSSSSKAKAGCSILVITNEEIVAPPGDPEGDPLGDPLTGAPPVATYCVKDQKYQAFNIEDLKADTSIYTLIKKGTWYYGIRGLKGRLSYDRRKDALEWTNKFKNIGGSNPDEGKDEEEFGVFAVGEGTRKMLDTRSHHSRSIYSQRVFRRIGFLRQAYYGAFQQIEHRSWVDMPYPFDLTDFSWRLLLDFCSDDPQAKESKAVDLMNGIVGNPIQECREFLRDKKCLVVINGLRSTQDWDLIKHTFLSEHIQSIVIVNPLDIKFNTYCNAKELQLGTQQGFTSDTYNKEYSRIFYTERCQKALEWIEKFESVEHGMEVSDRINLPNCGSSSVWGISGVGKSTIIRKVYYNCMLHSSKTKALLSRPRKLFKAFGWVDVPSPFNLTEFAWRLFLDFYSDDPQAKQTATVSMVEQGQVPILACCKILQEIRCFVVIDGLRSTQDWDLIKDTFLAKPIEGLVVVITNEKEVAMHCVKNANGQVHNIRRLKADASLNLFKKILGSTGKQLTSEEMAQSKTIVLKCGGLPKVIAAIGEVCKSHRWWLKSLRDNFMDTLETEPEFHGLRPLFSWMKSYFDACPDSLKPCIFYLSIFTAEKNIRWQRLLWRWIAEGYCRDTSDKKTCEENGVNYIYELVNLSIIQKSEVFCQINGFFHEYIISRPTLEDNLVFALEERCRVNSTRAGQHLTIRGSWERDKVVYESIDFSRLRSLTVFGEWKSFFISSKKVNMRLLRVLDLEDATDVSNEDLDQIVKQLPRLKFLSLRGCRKITCLPSSVGDLNQLQALDIRHTSIVMLPVAITKLHTLRYLRGGTSQVWDWEGGGIDDVVIPADCGEEKRASSAAEEGGDVVAGDGGEDRASSSAHAAIGGGGSNSTAPVLAPGSSSWVSCNNNWARTPNLVSSLLSKLRRRGGLDGVKVPVGIKNLNALHTLGVVNVNNGTCSATKSFFEELKKLTQLSKLGVSGIDKRNIKEFCKSISVLGHLQSLSVEVKLDDNDGNSDELDEPPKTLMNLKLYGHANKLLLAWIQKLHGKLKSLKFDHTIVKPEQSQALRLAMKSSKATTLLRVRSIQDGIQDSEPLHIDRSLAFAHVVEIWGSSVLHIDIDHIDGSDDGVWQVVKVLKIHFSKGSQSSLQISGISKLRNLKEVWLKGYTDAHKQYMQEQIAKIEPWQEGQKRPVLKLVKPRSS